MSSRALRLILMAALLLCEGGIGRSLRCGGIGPVPFSDISSTLKYQVETIDAVAGVKEFLYEDNSNAVVYRNVNNEIRGVKADSAGNFSQAEFFSTSVFPISTLVDPNEEFILTAGKGWLLDTASENWVQFNQSTIPLQHLFWDRDRIYSVAVSPQSNGDKRFDFYSYAVGSQDSRRTCSVMSTSDNPMTLGHGHTYPDVFFFREVSDGESRQVEIFPVNVTTCITDAPIVYSNVRGPVKDVYRFDSIDSTGVTVDNPDQNLLWANSKGCAYYDIKGLTPIIPNYSQPVVATFSADAGVNVYFMDNAKKASVLAGFPINELKDGDLWLSDSGRKLFMSPLFGGERYRWLVDLKLASDESVPTTTTKRRTNHKSGRHSIVNSSSVK